MIILHSHFIQFQVNIKSSVNFCLFGTFADFIHSSPTSYFKKEIQNFTMNKYFYFLKKMLIIQFPYMEIVWLAFFLMAKQKLWICPKLFLFFFQPQIDFCTQANISKNIFFACKIFIFCVHNVVLDSLILGFFSFSL